jgi:hypothetical protein
LEDVPCKITREGENVKKTAVKYREAAASIRGCFDRGIGDSV